MPSTASAATPSSLRSAWMNSTSPLSMCVLMLSIRPLERLSTTRTVDPRAINASTRCDPMKDAPPVTSDRVLCHCICCLLDGRHLQSGDDMISENDDVHPRAEETIERLPRVMNNRLVLV